MARLDAKKAAECHSAPANILHQQTTDLLSLEDGKSLYLKHVARPAVLGGTRPRTPKRYKAVLEKFITFAHGEAVHSWQSVTAQTLNSYAAWLDSEGYAYATEYLELTTLKQVVKWLIAQNKLPATSLINIKLPKPQGTTTYCYTQKEVDALVTHCFAKPGLIWLGQVVVALTTTGLRISELADLGWSDIDLVGHIIQLTDTYRQGTRTDRTTAQTTKRGRSRSLPFHDDLRRILITLPRNADGRVFHGPLGGHLKPDTVRNILQRDALEPLSSRFPALSKEKGLLDGRLHSFRHFFCSVCASSGVPEQTVMNWLGHADSKMVRRYFHLPREESQKQMAKVPFLTKLPETRLGA